MTLTRKFAIIFIAFSLFVVAIISVLALANAGEHLERETRHHIASLNTLKSDQFDLWMTANSASLSHISKRPLMIEYAETLHTAPADSEALQQAYETLYQEHLIQLIDEDIGFDTLFILHPDSGRILVSSNPALEGLFRENEPYFIEGHQGVYIQAPYYSLREQRQIITIASPLVRHDGTITGILAGHLDLDMATEIMATGLTDYHQTGDSFIVNKFNFYVTPSQLASAINQQDAIQTEGVNACLKENSGTDIYQNAQDITVLGAYLWLPQYDLCMITEIHQDEAYRSIANLRTNIAFAGGAVLILATTIGIFFSRSLIHPLKQLVADTGIIGQGNLDHRITDYGIINHRKDEIGELGRAFDQMVTNLKAVTASRDDLNEEIAHRIRTEQALSERERILEVSLKAAKAGTWMWDTVSKKATWDARSERIYGLEEGTFDGTYATWRKLIHPDDIKQVEVALNQALNGDTFLDIEFRTIQPEVADRIHYVLVQGIMMEDRDGNPERMIGVCIDITQRRLNEEALRRITTSLSERVKELSGLYDISNYENLDLPIETYLIRVCQRIPTSMQYPSLCEADIRYNGHSYGSPGARQLECRMIIPIEVDNRPVGEFIFGYKEPHDFLPEETLHLQEIARRIGLYIQRHENTSALRNTLIELEQSNKELQQFAYVASHDLQEPLRMISSYLQLLQKRYANNLDEIANQYIFYAIDGANRMKILTNALLNYSRLKTQVTPFITTPMSAIIATALKNLQLVIDEKEATITIDSDLPALDVDEVQMIQLWQNLVSNSLKYQAKETKPAVHIRAQEQTTGWLFSIQDNGIGIAPEFYEQVFVIFKRLHNRTQYDGTGIGLAVCQRIVERHHGRIWIESTVGEGTTFFFTIGKDLQRFNQSKSEDLEDDDPQARPQTNEAYLSNNP